MSGSSEHIFIELYSVTRVNVKFELCQFYIRDFKIHNVQSCCLLKTEILKKKNKLICYISGLPHVGKDFDYWSTGLCFAVSFGWGKTNFQFGQQNIPPNIPATGKVTILGLSPDCVGQRKCEFLLLSSDIYPGYWVKLLSLCVYINNKKTGLMWETRNFNHFALQSSAWVWKQATTCDYVQIDP